MKTLFKSTKAIITILFLCLCFTAQGQEMLRYEPTPIQQLQPLQSSKSSRQQSVQQSQQTKPQRQQEQTVRITGYYYKQNTPIWGSPTTYSVCKASLKVKIINTYNGEAYQVTSYKMQGEDSWQTCYGGNAYYDRDEEAYYVNTGTFTIYFNL